MKPAEYKELLKKPKRNKFGAVKKEFNGRMYHSTLEANYAMALEWHRKIGDIQEIIPQFPIELVVNGVKICRYVIDFKLIYPNGNCVYAEVKGKITPDFRLKWKLAHALYPEYNFILINKL